MEYRQISAHDLLIFPDGVCGMTEYLDLRPRASEEEPVEIDLNLSPVDHLLARLRDPRTDKLSARDRIAIALSPFFAPKLQATAVMTGKDFASLLEARMPRMKRLEARAVEPRPVAAQPEIKPHLPTVPDRRYRRF